MSLQDRQSTPHIDQSSKMIKIKHPSGVELEIDVSVLDKVVKALL